MKKLLIFTIILSFNYSNSQTKIETIDWIKSKLEVYLYNSLNKNSVDKVEVNECYCTIYYTSYTNMGELKNIMKIPTNIESIYNWLVPLNSNIEHYVFQQKRKKIIPVSRHFNGENTFPLYFREGENDLKNRLLKAFNHLNKFCSTKKETF